MKKLFTLITLITFFLQAPAQITVGSGTFPRPGDVFLAGVYVDDVIGLNVGTPGENKNWDFSNLGPLSELDTTAFLPKVQGQFAANFPEAESVIKTEGGEAYIQRNNTRLALTGFASTVGVIPGSPLITKNKPNGDVQKYAPLTYNSVLKSSSNFTVNLPVQLLGFLLDSIAGLPQIDSLRFKTTVTNDFVADSWGKIKIPGGKSYDALRVKNTRISKNDIEVMLPFPKIWINISTILGGGGGGGQLGGSDTTLTYTFYNDVVRDPIALVEFNGSRDTITSVTVKHELPTSSSDLIGLRADIKAYPNPAIDYVNFDLIDLPNGDYTIKMYNVLGTNVWRQTFEGGGNNSIRADLTKLNKGTYFYSLINSKGKIIATRRLLVIRP
jgi:hypothetical protein